MFALVLSRVATALSLLIPPRLGFLRRAGISTVLLLSGAAFVYAILDGGPFTAKDVNGKANNNLSLCPQAALLNNQDIDGTVICNDALCANSSIRIVSPLIILDGPWD